MADENGAAQPTEEQDGLNVTTSDFKSSDSKSEAKTDKSQGESQPSGKDEKAKDKGPGPWEKDLAERGLTDPRFSEYFSSVVQPYITQLEQGRGDSIWGGNDEDEQAAYELLNALRDDPEDTMSQLLELLGYQQEPDFDIDDEHFDSLGDEGDYESEDDSNDPYRQWIQEKMQAEEDQYADEMFAQHLDLLAERIPGFDEELYVHMYLATGNEQDAFNAYMKYHMDPEPEQSAPPQLGGAEGGTPPPSEPHYSSVGEAVSAFLDEDRAARAKR